MRCRSSTPRSPSASACSRTRVIRSSIAMAARSLQEDTANLCGLLALRPDFVVFAAHVDGHPERAEYLRGCNVTRFRAQNEAVFRAVFWAEGVAPEVETSLLCASTSSPSLEPVWARWRVCFD